MKDSVLTTKGWALLIVAAVLVAAGTINFAQRLTHPAPPTDGIDWVKTSDGVVVESFKADSPAGRKGVFGVLPGDRLIGVVVGDSEKRDQVTTTYDVQNLLETAGVNGRIGYLVERPSNPEDTRFYWVYIENLTPQRTLTSRDLYLNLIGVVYLLVGLFVFFKQGGRSPFALHFATLCLVAFVFHFYKPYGAFEDLDLAVDFLDNAALAIFAPVLLHFCAIYPVRYRFSERQPAARLPALRARGAARRADGLLRVHARAAQPLARVGARGAALLDLPGSARRLPRAARVGGDGLPDGVAARRLVHPRPPLRQERVGHRPAAVEVGRLGLGAGGDAVHAALRRRVSLRRGRRLPERDDAEVADGRGRPAARAHPAHLRQLGGALPPDGRGHGRAAHGRLRADDADHRADDRRRSSTSPGSTPSAARSSRRASSRCASSSRSRRWPSS